jgi:hypothetical protein
METSFNANKTALSITVFLGLLFLGETKLYAQTHAEESEHHESHHGMKGCHRLTLGLGHAHTSKGEVDGKTQWIVLPSMSLNYDYWLSDRWAIGLQTDLILETFIIEHGDEQELERTKPVSLVPVGVYKIGEHLAFFGGIGVEFAKEQNLTMTRLGGEYGWHLPKNWEVGIDLLWDGKWGYYNSWAIAFTASKIFVPKLH